MQIVAFPVCKLDYCNFLCCIQSFKIPHTSVAAVSEFPCAVSKALKFTRITSFIKCLHQLIITEFVEQHYITEVAVLLELKQRTYHATATICG